MKRTVALVLILCFAFSLLSLLPVSAEDWTYTLESGVLTVSGKGSVGTSDSGLEYYPWNSRRNEIKQVVVEDGITQIGKNAFSTCPNLRKAVFGNTMTSFCMDAVAYCTSLTELEFHCRLTYIGQGTVYSSGSLSKVTVTGQTREEFLALASQTNFNENYEKATFIRSDKEEERSENYGKAVLSFVPVPAGGIIENYPLKDGKRTGDTFTCFVVGGIEKAALADALSGGSRLRVTVTDEKTKKSAIIEKYLFDDRENESVDSKTLRLAVSRYGIRVEKDHAYTLTLEFYMGDDLTAYGTSKTGAFASSKNDDFIKNGGITHSAPPHGHTEGGLLFGDVDLDGLMTVKDLTRLLAAEKGKITLREGVFGDFSFDGKIGSGDGSAYLSLLEGNECFLLEPNGKNAYTVRGKGNMTGDILTVPSEFAGKPVTAVGADVFRNDKEITRLSLPESIDRIAAGAFLGCEALSRIDYGGDTVKWIATGAETSEKCIVAVKDVPDILDEIDLLGVPGLSSAGCYAEGLRLKSSGEILFSPNFNELRALIAGGRKYDEFTAYLRFTAITEKYTFPTVTAKPVLSKGEWVDFYLMSESIGAFCPKASARYEVDMVLIEDATGTPLYDDVFILTASGAIAQSPYYRPTKAAVNVLPGGKYKIQYTAGDGGKIFGNTLQSVEVGCDAESVKAAASPGYRFVSWSDGLKDAVRTDRKVGKNASYSACFVPDTEDTGVPNIFLYTVTGNPVMSKQYQDVTVLVTGCENEKENRAYSALIKGRGNSTWNSGASQDDHESKNSYRLKFDEKIKFLDVGEEKNRDFILLANKYDTSNVSNFIIWTLAKKMGTIPFVPDNTWAQLYVNNEYRGLYMVCEQIEVGKGKVEVDDSVASPDKGYLVEIDFRGGDGDPVFYVDGYRGSAGENPAFVIKSDITGADDIDFISDYMQKCHDALMSGDRERIEEYVDLDSLVDSYIYEELSRDVDAGRASFYLQKAAGGKLFFTAPWDFDLGYGGAVSGLVSQLNDCCTWYAALIGHKWFLDLVIDRMDELKPILDETLEVLVAMGEKIAQAAYKDAVFWRLMSPSQNTFDRYILPRKNWTSDRWKGVYNTLKSKRSKL